MVSPNVKKNNPKKTKKNTSTANYFEMDLEITALFLKYHLSTTHPKQIHPLMHTCPKAQNCQNIAAGT